MYALVVALSVIVVQPYIIHTYYGTNTGCYLAAYHQLATGEATKAICLPAHIVIAAGLSELPGAEDNNFNVEESPIP